jgi:potassium-transporting ATPase KdpC subunit
MKNIFISARLLLVLTLLTGGLYPLVVWAIGQGVCRDRAEGSLIERDGRIVGSELLAQRTSSPRYFWARPSASDYATVASGASNQAWTSARLASVIAERHAAFDDRDDVPAELLTASGSGLDPHLSPEAVRVQVERVARVRRLDATQRRALDDWIANHTEGGQLSPPRINVLRLNLALDALAR